MSCGNIKHGEGCTCISCYTYRKAMPVPTAPPIAPAQWSTEQVMAIRAQLAAAEAECKRLRSDEAVTRVAACLRRHLANIALGGYNFEPMARDVLDAALAAGKG